MILSKAREGKVHDKRAHDEDDIVGSIPEEIPVEADSGFLGLQKQYENIHLPHKKPKGGEFDQIQREENRLLCIVRLDKLSRNDDLQAKLEQTDWDLIICDEAHKMSASCYRILIME